MRWRGVTPPTRGLDRGLDWLKSFPGGLLTSSSTNLAARSDLQLATANVLTPGGLSYVTGSYHTFGNDGSLAVGSVPLGLKEPKPLPSSD